MREASSGGHKMIPWVGVACRLQQPDAVKEAALLEGQAFCFLPLPVSLRGMAFTPLC